MPRRLYRRRRPAYSRRRRPYRSRRLFRRRPRAVLSRQRYVRERLKAIQTVYYGQTIDGGEDWSRRHNIAFQQPSAPPDVIGFNKSTRWTSLFKEYEQYAITGLKVRWVPGSVQGYVDPTNSSKQSGLTSVVTFTDINTTNTTGYQMAQIL